MNFLLSWLHTSSRHFIFHCFPVRGCDCMNDAIKKQSTRTKLTFRHFFVCVNILNSPVQFRWKAFFNVISEIVINYFAPKREWRQGGKKCLPQIAKLNSTHFVIQY